MQKTRAQLKSTFRRGYKPTESDYGDVFDSLFNIEDDPGLPGGNIGEFLFFADNNFLGSQAYVTLQNALTSSPYFYIHDVAGVSVEFIYDSFDSVTGTRNRISADPTGNDYNNIELYYDHDFGSDIDFTNTIHLNDAISLHWRDNHNNLTGDYLMDGNGITLNVDNNSGNSSILTLGISYSLWNATDVSGASSQMYFSGGGGLNLYVQDGIGGLANISINPLNSYFNVSNSNWIKATTTSDYWGFDVDSTGLNSILENVPVAYIFSNTDDTDGHGIGTYFVANRQRGMLRWTSGHGYGGNRNFSDIYLQNNDMYFSVYHLNDNGSLNTLYSEFDISSTGVELNSVGGFQAQFIQDIVWTKTTDFTTYSQLTVGSIAQLLYADTVGEAYVTFGASGVFISADDLINDPLSISITPSGMVYESTDGNGQFFKVDGTTLMQIDTDTIDFSNLDIFQINGRSILSMTAGAAGTPTGNYINLVAADGTVVAKVATMV